MFGFADGFRGFMVLGFRMILRVVVGGVVVVVGGLDFCVSEW